MWREDKTPINMQSQIELKAYNLNAGLVQADDIYFNNTKKKCRKLSTFLKEIEYIYECNIFASVRKNSILFKKKGYLTAEFIWAIVGLPASFNFDTQYLLMLKSKINPASGDKSYCTIRINDFGICILGACALKAVNKTMQIEAVLTNISDNMNSVEIIQCDIKYNSKDTTIANGAHFIPCQKSACLFVYDLNNRKNTIDINYPYQLCNFGQIKVEWTWRNNSEIYYGNEIKKENEILSDINLIFVSQVLDDCKNKNCKYYRFINVNTSKVIYRSLNSELLDFIGTIGSIAYLSFPSKN
ncbi:hypothetical protein F8M41_004007 [Gigaspora margarita]|uniref:Uncharacterized protein n=1 Tax=Gigaspora margarita TaxID=4874 RepID=A0A8H4AXY0_GIGMA|nr:hypothetical protein F8M41_004007 [Gigaspora margarita]